MTRAQILVVDDDPHLREVVRYALEREGFAVREAADGVEALDVMGDGRTDLVVLDVLMPELDGIEVCRRIRKESSVPIVFLSSRGDEVDRVLGLELGGDDYVTKPFSPRELTSRVKAVLRRTQPITDADDDPSPPAMKVGRVTLDPALHRVHCDAQEIKLTATEFRILQVLMSHPGRAYSRFEIMQRAYPGRHHVAERTLDSHIRRIRSRFEVHDADPVQTVHGVGYRFEAP